MSPATPPFRPGLRVGVKKGDRLVFLCGGRVVSLLVERANGSTASFRVTTEDSVRVLRGELGAAVSVTHELDLYREAARRAIEAHARGDQGGMLAGILELQKLDLDRAARARHSPAA